MFIAGSIPERLLPRSDPDIFFIVNNDSKDEFFHSLSKIRNRFS